MSEARWSGHKRVSVCMFLLWERQGRWQLFWHICRLITAPSSAAQQQEETSLEADEPDNNHEVKQKTKEEKKFVSAD